MSLALFDVSLYCRTFVFSGSFLITATGHNLSLIKSLKLSSLATVPPSGRRFASGVPFTMQQGLYPARASSSKELAVQKKAPLAMIREEDPESVSFDGASASSRANQSNYHDDIQDVF